MTDSLNDVTNCTGHVYFDLTHIAPMYEALNDDLALPDFNKPIDGSKAICGHGYGVRVSKQDLPTKLGYFKWGMYSLDEHFATHVDSQCHFETTEPGLKIADPDRRYAHEFTLDDLIGPIVYIDISHRTELELANNGGQPSPNKEITDFSNNSDATVRLVDIEAVEDYIIDRCFIVFNTGWERHIFGRGPENEWYHPYNNGLNYPGVTPEVVDWLVELEERKRIRINGLIADNIAVESGESLRGAGGNIDVNPPCINGAYLHAVGLQRGWKLVENAANLHSLKGLPQGKGTMIVGAARVTGISGSPARLIAAYPNTINT